MFGDKRIALFVDLIGQFYNVSLIFKKQKLNYKAYLDKLTEEGNVYKAIAYGASIGNEADTFIKCLRSNGYETKYVPARKYNGKPIIKYTDRTMDIAIDIIRMMDRLDIVVIGSCNINLVPLLSFLKEKGIKVIIFACHIPVELKIVCDEWWEVTENLLEIKEFYNEEEKINEITNTA